MPAPDLYAVLGVRQNASAEAIRKAHRKKVRQHHPDRGGDQEAFERVQLAWEVLSDPVRRQRYDETGETDPPKDARLVQVAATLARTFHTVVGDLVGKGREPEQVDLVALMRDHLRREKGQRLEGVRDVEKNLRTLRKVAEKFQRSTAGDNLLRGIALEPIASAEASLQAAREELEHLTECLKVLDDYRFETEAAPSSPFGAVEKSFNDIWQRDAAPFFKAMRETGKPPEGKQ